MKVVVPIAIGCEEMEVVIIVDVLRRADWQVTVAALDEEPIAASRGVKLSADCRWDEVDFDDQEALILPGGLGGTQRLCSHEGVQAVLRQFVEMGRWVGSICAAALALHAAGVLKGKAFTCYPGIEKQLPADVQPVDERVVVDGKLITSQGPGTAFEFALAWIAVCDGEEKAAEVNVALLL
jgi:4-methyl-5(b-hydroxyethyl)-thiazole monophosphate biosynthesis